VDETPVLEADVQASEKPVGAIGELISGQGSRYFALVTKVTEVVGSLISLEVM
jgi:hypothetical protein